MKHTAINHPKTRRLKRLLKLSQWEAIGLLECLWQLTAEYAFDGRIGRLSNAEIADWMEYDGDADELVNALVAANWLDTDEEHRLVVHQWLEHCPDYVRKRILRADNGSQCPPPADNGETLSDNGRQRPPPVADVCLTEPNRTEPNKQKMRLPLRTSQMNQRIMCRQNPWWSNHTTVRKIHKMCWYLRRKQTLSHNQ